MRDEFGVLEDRLVYLRPVDKADLPEEVLEETAGVERLWSVHNSDGQQLALIGDLAMAQDLAKQFKYTTQSVH